MNDLELSAGERRRLYNSLAARVRHMDVVIARARKSLALIERTQLQAVELLERLHQAGMS